MPTIFKHPDEYMPKINKLLVTFRIINSDMEFVKKSNRVGFGVCQPYYDEYNTEINL